MRLTFILRLLAIACLAVGATPLLHAQDQPKLRKGDEPSGQAPPSTDAPTGGRSIDLNEDGSPLTEKGSGKISVKSLQFLQSVEERHGKAKNLIAEFNQVKESDIFLEKIESKGKFWFTRPDLFRCDYADETSNLIVKDAIYVHTPKLKQVERYRFRSPEERDQQLHTMLLGFGFKPAEILREYDMRSSEDDEALTKELKDAQQDPAKTVLLLASPIAKYSETSPFNILKIWIDRETLQPQKIWFEDYNGEKTTISVLDVKFDQTFDPATFEPKFPAGTEMIDKTDVE